MVHQGRDAKLSVELLLRAAPLQQLSAEVFGPIYQEGETLLETVEGLLLAVGYTVDISTDSLGKCKVRCRMSRLSFWSKTAVVQGKASVQGDSALAPRSTLPRRCVASPA